MWCVVAFVFTAATLGAVEAQVDKVTLQPQSHVAYPGTNVSFYCEGISSETNHLGINDELYLGGRFPNSDIVSEYRRRNFTWWKDETIRDGVRQTFWVLHVIASPANNNTKVVCFYGSKISNKAFLYVVEGPPGPPEAPTLTATNTTAINLTWTAPWSFPVSNYTITMLNLSSGQESQWTACEEQFVVRGEGGGQCDELQFTVEAETEVGSSGPSAGTTGGFPKAIAPVNGSELEVDLRKSLQNVTAFLHITIKPPDVCYYQTLSYTYEVTEWESKSIILQESTTFSNVTFSDGILFNVRYFLNLTLKNNEWESYSVIRNFSFDTGPTSTANRVPASTAKRVAITTRSIPQITPTVSATRPLEPRLIIAVIPGAVVALISFPALFLLSWWLCVCRAQRNKVLLRKRQSTRSFVPPMAKNPIYDGTDTEIYEFIPHLSDLNTIDFPASNLPPNLPPRQVTMDITIPNKHACDSTEDVVAAVVEPATNMSPPPPPPAGAVSSTEDGGGYIAMTSSLGPTSSTPSPRYTEPPTLDNMKISYDLHFQHYSDNDGYDRLATMNTP